MFLCYFVLCFVFCLFFPKQLQLRGSYLVLMNWATWPWQISLLALCLPDLSSRICFKISLLAICLPDLSSRLSLLAICLPDLSSRICFKIVLSCLCWLSSIYNLQSAFYNLQSSIYNLQSTISSGSGFLKHGHFCMVLIGFEVLVSCQH